MIPHPSPLHIGRRTLGAIKVLSVGGILDSTTYRPLRDSIIKAALDEPVAVIVDVSSLRIPAPSATAVFTSARWQVSRWPDVPVLLSCTDETRRQLLLECGIGRYVPIHADIETAADSVGAIGRGRVRRRAQVELMRSRGSIGEAKDFVTECLVEWSHPDLVTHAKVIATELVRNVLAHTDSAPCLRVESSGESVTIAVDDASTRPPALSESTINRRVSGLQMVAGLSRAWGSAPSPTGKTVWAIVGPDRSV